jgi:uncharacterized membrane protein
MTNLGTIAARDEGRTAALVVYALYLLSIPSAGTLMLIGVVIAYIARASADDWVRTHFTEQVRLFWISLWWAVGLFVASIPALALTVVLIGFPLLWLIAMAGLVVLIWFTVRSVMGLVRLLDGQPVR